MFQNYVTRAVKRKSLENNECRILIKRKFKEDDCSICIENVETVVSLDTCLHEFCLLCLCKWLSMHNLCPKCKQVPSNLLYHVDKDSFLLSLPLNDFKQIWNKTNFIMEIFSIKQHKINKLNAIFKIFLTILDVTVELQRKLLYFCDMKTILPKFSKLKWNPDQIYFDSNHKIWEWLKIELNVFYPKLFVEKRIQLLQNQVKNYESLKKKLSDSLPEPILSKFLSEMNTFLSYFHSTEKYYKNSFVIVQGRVPGNVLQSVIIENQYINVSLLAKIIVEKVLNFDSKPEEFDYMTPAFEISHVHRLIKSIIKQKDSDKGKTEKIFSNFISLRLERSVVFRKKKILPTYNNCYELDEDYQFIYLNFLKDQLKNSTPNSMLNKSSIDSDPFFSSSRKSAGQITIDLTGE